MTEHANSALLSYRIGGREYPVRTSARCRTCRSPHRRKVEALLVQGQPHTAIVQALPRGCGLTPANIGEHYRRGHVAADTEIGRQLLDEQAEVIGREVAADAGCALTERAFALRVVKHVYEAIASGELQPTVRDAIAAARFLFRYDPIILERDRLRGQLAQSQARLMRLLEVVDDVIEEDRWGTFVRAANADPDLAPFLFLYERMQEQRPRSRA